MGTNDKHDIAKNLIEQETNTVMMMPTRVRENGCVACHILFTLVNRMGISEASAFDQLSEILIHDDLCCRNMGVSFSLKNRDSKMKDGLYDLNIDLVNYGKDFVMRKLLITYLSLQLAQSIGIDHHAAKEELYYYMRTKDNETHTMLTEFMDHFYEKVCKDEKSGSENVR